MKELDIIQTTKELFSSTAQGVIKGIGDDCAVFGDMESRCWLISTDLLVENSHFKLEWQSPFTLGRKSIGVNLSDIAAMGGTPRFILLSLVLPKDISERWLDEYRRGVKSILQDHDCHLIGGDTTSGDHLTISVTIIGSTAPELVVYRSGAKVGQDIYVTGPLGSSAIGLELLRKGYREQSEFHELIMAHLDPSPQIKAGLVLAQCRLIGAMQDISDGLSTDLSHICKESGVGALLIEADLPFHPQSVEVCNQHEFDLRSLILHGGEDYQLVFTTDSTNRKMMKQIAQKIGQPFHRVGSIQKEQKVYLQSVDNTFEDIQFKGFEHATD